jgi:hypothetical protein
MLFLLLALVHRSGMVVTYCGRRCWAATGLCVHPGLAQAGRQAGSWFYT